MIRRFLGLERRDLTFSDVWGRGIEFFGMSSAAGQTVTTETAMRLSAVYGSWRLLSENVATLPIDTFITWDGAAKPYRPRPPWLDFEVNDWGQIEVLSQAMLSLLSDGNAYFLTPRDALGQILAVDILDPAQVAPERLAGRLRHRVNGELLPLGMVEHVPGMMHPSIHTDGLRPIKGLSPLAYARETIGLGLAAQEYGARFFGNGALPGALIETPGQMSDTGVKQLKAAWADIHQGAKNAHRLAVLTEGAKFSKVTLSPDEAQFLETRKFQVPDIARIYGVPPHLLADASNSTSWGSGLAEQNTAFAQLALRPWVSRLEAGFTRLLRSEGRAGMPYVRLDMESVTRGSLKDLVETLNAAVLNGIYNLDEAREKLGKAPLPNGKGQIHRMPLNLGPVGETPPATTRSALESALLRLLISPEEGAS